MKTARIISFLFIVAVLLFGCGHSTGGGGDSTEVIITLGGGEYSAEAIPPDVTGIRFIITGPALNTIIKTVPLDGSPSVTVGFTVINGPDRRFLAEALDAAGNVMYAGAQMTDLYGAPVYLNIYMANIGGDRLPPAPPSGLAADAVSQTQIDLSWSASTDNVGVTGYNVYEVSPAAGLLFSSSNPTSSVTGLLSGAEYCFSVTATDAAGNESVPSSPACATTLLPSPSDNPPTPPSGLAADAVSQTQIDLSWSASTDDVGVTGYNVYEVSPEAGLLFGTAGLSASVTDLSAATGYCFVVTATDDSGNESGPSNTACATTLSPPPVDTPPTPPAGLLAAAFSDSRIDLSWTASMDDVGVVGYNVYDISSGLILSAATTAAQVTGLLPSTEYCFEVTAVDTTDKESGPSNTACATTLAPSALPAPPTAVSATSPSRTQINLTWTAPPDSPVTYNVYEVSPAAGLLFNVTTTSASVTDLEPATAYCFEVTSLSATGIESLPSNTVCVTTSSADARSETWDSPKNGSEYYIRLRYPDPDKSYSKVTVTGAGIASPKDLLYDTTLGLWETAMYFFPTHPTPPLSYIFRAWKPGTRKTTEYDTVGCFMEDFATNLSPSGTVSVQPASYGWTKVASQGIEYEVRLYDGAGVRVWVSQTVTDAPSVAYNGPALADGSYTYHVAATPAGTDCSSIAVMGFTLATP